MKSAVLPAIVADIGGTNCRFAVAVEDDVADTVKLVEARTFRSHDFAQFEDAIAAYVDSVGLPQPEAVSLAIAGPVAGDEVKVTNLPWTFSIAAVARRLGLRRLECMNDFAALAYATVMLGPEDLMLVKPGEALPRKPKAVLGAGTGLGISGLVHDGVGWLPIAGEGGHATIAPVSRRELEIRQVVQPDDQHISLERFLSGPGLVNIHRALSSIEGVHYSPLTPEEIGERASVGSEQLCVDTLLTFFGLLGAAAGNTALNFGAQGGVYLGGGILPQFPELLARSHFVERFVGKGRMSALLSEVPVWAIVGKDVALLGAAFWLVDQHRRRR